MQSTDVAKETVDLKIIHHSFKLLRLLNLFGIKTSSGALPKEIGNLIHLRYLGVRASNIKKFPKSIGKLRNLLTLDYRNIDSDETIRIPNVLCNLMPLRHLYLPIESPWTVEELQLSELNNLQILWGVKCLSGDWFSREIPKLSTSLKKLKVVVSTEKDLEAAFRCPSLVCDKLHTFHCEWSRSIALCVTTLTSIFPHNQHLHKLVLVGKIGVMKRSLVLPSNLLILELKDSALEEDPMIVAGALGHLKLLRLSNSYMGKSFMCNFGSFPQLEELYLDNIQHVRFWEIQAGALSSLKKLDILNCQMLHFPRGLAFVTTLQHLDYFGVPKIFGEQATACGWSQKRLRLPHNYEAIIEKCDTPLDISYIHKLFEQLTTGIFLNNKRKKFWVVKQDDHQYNCFLVYAIDLSLATAVDVDGLPEWNNNMFHWAWTDTKESNGALIEVAKLISPVQVLHVSGKLSIEYLSPEVIYTFSFVIMLDDSKSVEDMHFDSLLMLPYGRFQYPPHGRLQRQSHNLSVKPRNEWLKVPIGEFETRSNMDGEAEFSLHCHWRQTSEIGFAIKAVIIEPKLNK